MSIIDTPWKTVSKLSCLAANGVGTVIRYYNFSNSSRLPEKCMKLDEAEAICAAGMNLAVVFQQRQSSAEDFSEFKGYEAGRRAYRYAHNDIGQPAGSGIYFSVDFDATDNEISHHILPYFEGVQRAFKDISGGEPIYRVGVYGSGAVCGRLFKGGLCALRWLSMSQGFDGTRQAFAAGEYELAQRGPEAKLCGLDVDYDAPLHEHTDFGAFTVAADPVAANVRFTHLVVSRGNLRLREGPGTQYDVVGSLQPGQRVVAGVANGEWSSIDVEGDGLIDGFAASAYLREIS